MQLAGAALWHLVSFDDERAAARAYNVALREAMRRRGGQHAVRRPAQ